MGVRAKTPYRIVEFGDSFIRLYDDKTGAEISKAENEGDEWKVTAKDVDSVKSEWMDEVLDALIESARKYLDVKSISTNLPKSLTRKAESDAEKRKAERKAEERKREQDESDGESDGESE